MRDWRDFLPASFRGFPFEVEREDATGGRHVAVHEYVRAESHDTEDLGRKATRWSVTAYLASDLVDAEATALFSICTQPGAGLLVLPWIEPTFCRCVEVKRSSASDTMGKVAFDLTFVEAGGALPTVTQLFDLMAASAASALSGLVRPILQGFSR